jgi:hypothetical protein
MQSLIMLSHTRFLIQEAKLRWSRSPCRITSTTKDKSFEWLRPVSPWWKRTQRLILSQTFELNKRIKRKPFPIPKIQTMLQNLEGFMYATSLDFNMDTIIWTSRQTLHVCAPVLPWLRIPCSWDYAIVQISSKRNEWSHVWLRVCSRLYRRPLNNFYEIRRSSGQTGTSFHTSVC